MHGVFKSLIIYTAWPALFSLCIAVTACGFSAGYPLAGFNTAYLLLILSLFFLEIKFPHEQQWCAPDGQTWANIAHTMTSKGVIQGLVIFGGVIGLSDFFETLMARHQGIWPHDWPMAAQVILGLVAAEFGLYWAHRLAHEIYFFWKFHAIHHSVTKLWIVNTGRFHFMDSVFSILFGSAILLSMGAPADVIMWLSALTAFLGMLTHCNVEMRPGPLSYLFNTPELHRWHHSRDLVEGNKNYGENIMLWDHVFGTFYNPDRRPPVNIGIDEFMPPRFMEQLIWPFIDKRGRARIKARYISRR